MKQLKNLGIHYKWKEACERIIGFRVKTNSVLDVQCGKWNDIGAVE